MKGEMKRKSYLQNIGRTNRCEGEEKGSFKSSRKTQMFLSFQNEMKSFPFFKLIRQYEAPTFECQRNWMMNVFDTWRNALIGGVAFANSSSHARFNPTICGLINRHRLYSWGGIL